MPDATRRRKLDRLRAKQMTLLKHLKDRIKSAQSAALELPHDSADNLFFVSIAFESLYRLVRSALLDGKVNKQDDQSGIEKDDKQDDAGPGTVAEQRRRVEEIAAPHFDDSQVVLDQGPSMMNDLNPDPNMMSSPILTQPLQSLPVPSVKDLERFEGDPSVVRPRGSKSPSTAPEDNPIRKKPLELDSSSSSSSGELPGLWVLDTQGHYRLEIPGMPDLYPTLPVAYENPDLNAEGDVDKEFALPPRDAQPSHPSATPHGIGVLDTQGHYRLEIPGMPDLYPTLPEAYENPDLNAEGDVDKEFALPPRDAQPSHPSATPHGIGSGKDVGTNEEDVSMQNAQGMMQNGRISKGESKKRSVYSSQTAKSSAATAVGTRRRRAPAPIPHPGGGSADRIPSDMRAPGPKPAEVFTSFPTSPSRALPPRSSNTEEKHLRKKRRHAPDPQFVGK